MRFLLLPIVLILSFSCSSESNTSQQRLIHAIAQEIAESRPPVEGTSETISDYQNIENQLGLKIVEEVPSFNSELGIESAIAELTGLDKSEVKKFGGSAAEGLSGNSLFIALKKGIPAYAVKVFEAGLGDFNQEFLALITYKNLHLSNFHVPDVSAVGSSTLDGKTYLLLAEEYVPGSLFSQQMESLLHNSVESNNRKQALEQLIRIHDQLGRALAELHTAGHPISHVMYPLFYEYYLKIAADGTQAITKKNPNDQQLAEETHIVFQKLLKNRGLHPYGYIHGDAHYGNYIWDEKQGKLTAIDLTDGGSSIGQNGHPIGNPMLDVARVVTDFSFWKLWGLTDNEETLLQNAFVSSYQKVNPAIEIDGSEYHLFQLINAYRYFGWFMQRYDSFSPDVKSRLEPKWNNYLRIIREIAERYK
jgi:hypothetical protein